VSVASVALASGEGEVGIEFAAFADKSLDSDGDSVVDTAGWVGGISSEDSNGTVFEITASEAASYFPRVVISGGSLQYPDHYTSLFESRDNSDAHFMGAFLGADATSYHDVATDAEGIVAASGLVDAVGSRGPHLLLHEPGAETAYVWPYLNQGGPSALKPFSLASLVDTVTGAPGFTYLGQKSSENQYAFLIPGRGAVAAAVIGCPIADPNGCALALDGTTISIPLDDADDDTLSVSATTMRESSLVAALARVKPYGGSGQLGKLILLGLSGLLRDFTVFPQGFAGQGTRLVDAQITSMRSTLLDDRQATTIGYAALVENDASQDELHFGMLRACDER
jgi:hypothetical protein